MRAPLNVFVLPSPEVLHEPCHLTSKVIMSLPGRCRQGSDSFWGRELLYGVNEFAPSGKLPAAHAIVSEFSLPNPVRCGSSKLGVIGTLWPTTGILRPSFHLLYGSQPTRALVTTTAVEGQISWNPLTLREIRVFLMLIRDGTGFGRVDGTDARIKVASPTP